MTGFDYAVLLIIGLSALRGLWRGLLAELFALIGWIAALIIAGYTADLLAPYLPAHWPGGAFTQFLLAFILIMIAGMLITGVLGALFARLIGALGMRTLDSSLGLAFGIVRGILLVVAGAALAGLTDLPRQDFGAMHYFNPMLRRASKYSKRISCRRYWPLAISESAVLKHSSCAALSARSQHFQSISCSTTAFCYCSTAVRMQRALRPRRAAPFICIKPAAWCAMSSTRAICAICQVHAALDKSVIRRQARRTAIKKRSLFISMRHTALFWRTMAI